MKNSWKKRKRNKLGQFKQSIVKTNHTFENIENSSQAYWLGFLMADGSIIKDYISLQLQASDINHLIKYTKHLSKDLSVKINTRKKDERKYAKVCFKNPIISKNLKKYGCISNKSKSPIIIKNIPKKFYNHFIRGYFDGDGSIGVYKTKSYSRMIQLKITSKFSETILNLQKFIPIPTSIIIEKNKRAAHLYIKGGILNIKDFISWLYYDSKSNTRLKRKFEIAREILKFNPLPKGPKRKNSK